MPRRNKRVLNPRLQLPYENKHTTLLLEAGDDDFMQNCLERNVRQRKYS